MTPAHLKNENVFDYIPKVLAILAIGLVNISFVSLSGFKIQGPENATYADLFTGGWVYHQNELIERNNKC